jgi:hypothetical protein
VILILADAGNEHAAALAEALSPAGAAVLTPIDLATDPSALHHPDVGRSWLTLAGRQRRIVELTAVVTLLNAILPWSLACYDAAEREYQASEMHAWLAFFLASLRCPVVNPPSPLSLSGPVLNPFGWRALAAGCRLPLAAGVLDSDRPESHRTSNADTVTVLGGRVIHSAGPRADGYALRLAAHAGVVHLRAAFRGPDAEFVSAASVPDAGDERTRVALVKWLQS